MSEPLKLSLELEPFSDGYSFRMTLRREATHLSVMIPADLIYERVQEYVNNALRALSNDLQQQLKKLRQSNKENTNNER